MKRSEAETGGCVGAKQKEALRGVRLKNDYFVTGEQKGRRLQAQSGTNIWSFHQTPRGHQ